MKQWQSIGKVDNVEYYEVASCQVAKIVDLLLGNYTILILAKYLKMKVGKYSFWKIGLILEKYIDPIKIFSTA